MILAKAGDGLETTVLLPGVHRQVEAEFSLAGGVWPD